MHGTSSILCRISLLILLAATASRADDWPQWRGLNRDGLWNEKGIVDKLAPNMPPLWRTPIGPGFSGPSVAAGRVFVMDRVLDTGKDSDVQTKWNFRDKTIGQERILCFDASSGKILWAHAYDCIYAVSYGQGPRATPTVAGDHVYTVGAMGDLFCFEAATGKVIWKKRLVQDYAAQVPLYGYSNAPLANGNRLFIMVGGKGQCVVALDRLTGKELWKSLDAPHPGYSTPIIATLGGRRQLIVWNGEGLAGLDPESGKELWSVPHPTKEALAIATPAIEGDRLVVSSQYEGALMLQFNPDVPAPKVLWKASTGGVIERDGFKKSGLNTTLSPVLFFDNHVYGVSLYGETACLSGDTGQRLWTTLQPSSGGDKPKDRWSTFFAVRHTPTGQVFIFNERGDLIQSKLSPTGYEEMSRTHLLDPDMLSSGGGRKVIWSHPAFANRTIYVRNNRELIAVPLTQK